jgi:PAS domain S-box-containing protein
MNRDTNRLEQVLDDSLELFANVIESLAEGVLITDREHRILYANRQMESITGFDPEEIVGRVSHEVLVPPEQWPLMLERLRQRKRGEREDYELEIIRRDGNRLWVSVRAVPLRGEEGDVRGTVGLVRDISARKRLERENATLQDELACKQPLDHLIGRSQALRGVLDQVAIVGPTDAPVLISGESGTGKELVAGAIHAASLRNQRPMIRVNCAAISPELFESEFFGHVRGAFTGAVKDRMGRFELADGGTLFLDEIGEVPLALQGKLLRALQEGQFEPVGSDATKHVNVRVIAATNRDLPVEVERGGFRRDLYYRLTVFPIEVPPLRERLEDVELLAPHFVTDAARMLGVRPPPVTPQDIAALRDYDWPGNVRELEHTLERAVILSKGKRLHLDLGSTRGERTAGRGAPSPVRGPAPHTLADLKDLEREILLEHLEAKNWKIYGPRGAAESLGIRPTTLVSKMKRLGIQKPL